MCPKFVLQIAEHTCLGWSHISVFGEWSAFTPSLNVSFLRKAKARNHPKFNRVYYIHQMPLSPLFSKTKKSHQEFKPY